MDEFELKKQILDSIDDDYFPNLSNDIISKHIINTSKKVPWWKSKKLLNLGVPALACLVIGATILGTTLGSASNVFLANENTEEAYSLSTLSLANVISVSDGDIASFKNTNYNPVLKNTPRLLPGEPAAPWATWEGWSYISQSSLNRAINIINPYMFVADKLLEENMKVEPTAFKHNHKFGFEQYECNFENEDFKCGFKFTEKASKDKKKVSVNGNLSVDNTTYTVKGTRKNVSANSTSNVALGVQFSNIYNSALTFQEKKLNTISEIDRSSYVYTYKEHDVILYEISMSLVTQFLYGITPSNAISLALTTYLDSQSEMITFSVSRNPIDGRLNVFLNVPGFNILIDVVDENGNYVYYLQDFADDPLSHKPKH